MWIERDIVKTVCVVTLLCGVYGGVVYWPSQRQSQALAQEIHAKQQTLDQTQVPDLAPLRSDIAALRAELRENSVQLPQGDAPYRVLDRLSAAIRAQDITVYDTSHRPAKQYARLAITPVEVRFSSGFEQAFEILRTIETAGAPVRIERLELTGSADEISGHVGVDLQLSSFFQTTQSQGGQR